MITRRTFAVRTSAVLAASVLAGCAGAGPASPLVTASTANDLKSQGKALVVMSAAVKTQALWTSEWPAKLTFGLKTSDIAKQVESMFTIERSAKSAEPRVVEVRAGSYDLMTFSYEVGNAKFTNSAGLIGAPLTTFSVAPGDVVYLGHVLIVQEPSILAQSKPKFKIEVHTNEVAARQAVEKLAPALSAATVIRPVVFPAMLAGG